MPLEIIDCQQGSDEWFIIRLGKVTSSRFGDVLVGGKGLTRQSYLYQLIGERITGKVADTFQSAEMRWGIENESRARATYQLETGKDVLVPGFCKLNENIGSSTDGLIDNDGVLEIMCPSTKNHIKNILTNSVPTNKLPEIYGELLVTGRQWCDFVSFDPRISGNACLFVKRIERDEEMIKKIEAAVNIFVAELQAKVKLLKAA